MGQSAVSAGKVIVQWATPPVFAANVFSQKYTLKVPAGKVAAYQAAPMWSAFSTIAEVANDATLQGITANWGSYTLAPVFNPTHYNYTVSVSNSVSSIYIDATKNHTDAMVSMSVNGNTYGGGYYDLTVGANVFTIVVTADDGVTQSTYTVTVNRAEMTSDEDATLQNLTISEGTLNFNSNTTQYTVYVGNCITSVALTPTPNNAAASVNITGSYNALNVGGNAVSIRVTAKDGTTQKTYSLTIVRASPDAALLEKEEVHGQLMLAKDTIGTLRGEKSALQGDIVTLVNDTLRLYTALQTAEGIHDTVTVSDTITNTIRDTITVNTIDTLRIPEFIHDTVIINNTNSLNARIAALQADSAATHNTLTAVENHVAALQSTISTLQIQVTSLQSQLAQCNANPTAVVGTKSLPSLQVYPNPVINEQLIVDNEQLVAGDKIEVFSISGALLKTFVATGAKSSIDLSALPTGSYVVKAGNRTAKVAKQ
jgi:uncharacterized coiled-coil protein SlyX